MAVRVRVKGAVQGVGFRPFCYRQATSRGLLGYVLNDLGGVLVHLEGSHDAIRGFLEALRTSPPPASRITAIECEEVKEQGFKEFRIVQSEAGETSQTLEVSADLATCTSCLKEILDAGDRRLRYAFTNCTDCGPRYTIIRELPYDRPKTTMSEFRMCQKCQHEYDDPLDRRFHAQPNACKACGPELVLLDARGRILKCKEPLAETARIIQRGGIVAIKGLGGYHLVCDAMNPNVVRELRKRKRRPAKALALMCRDTKQARTIAVVSEDAEAVLRSSAAPILLFEWARTVPAEIRDAIAPQSPGVGIMLAYAPIHHILFASSFFERSKKLDARGPQKRKKQSLGKGVLGPLVATSANKADEPIIAEERELFAKLSHVFDAVLTHNRGIENRIDDSLGYINPVVSHDEFTGTPNTNPKGSPHDSLGTPDNSPDSLKGLHLVRRARGFAPQPFQAPFEFPAALAVGAEMKGSFAISDGRRVWLSPHIGEMTNRKTIEFFEETLKRYLGWFRVEPKIVVTDMHPDYLATRWAEKYSLERRIPLISVQHHHAHIAAVIFEHHIEEPVIGLALDGTGYGYPEDSLRESSGAPKVPHESADTQRGPQKNAKYSFGGGEIWGCELLHVTDYGAHFERLGHLKPLPLVGGALAIRKPRRMAAGVVADLFGAGKAIELFGDEGRIVARQLDSGVGVSQDELRGVLRMLRVSSAGRLFDAVAGLLGLVDEVSFEAQAAVALESLCPRDLKSFTGYPFEINEELLLDPGPCFAAILEDLSKGAGTARIAARFHLGLKDALLSWAASARERSGISRLALSGGVFANRTLALLVQNEAEEWGFKLYTPRLIPASDGGVAAGQIQVVAALARLRPSNAQTT